MSANDTNNNTSGDEGAKKPRTRRELSPDRAKDVAKKTKKTQPTNQFSSRKNNYSKPQTGEDTSVNLDWGFDNAANSDKKDFDKKERKFAPRERRNVEDNGEQGEVRSYNRKDKPFDKKDRSERQERSGDRDSFKKREGFKGKNDRSFDKEDKPFRKDRNFDKNERPANRSGKPFEKREKSFDREDKPFRKDRNFDKNERPANRSDKPFEKREKSFDREDKPFRKDRNFDKNERPANRSDKPFEKREKSFDREDKPFRKERNFDKNERPANRSDKPFEKREKSFDREDKPFRKDKPFDKKDRSFGKNDKFADKKEQTKPENPFSDQEFYEDERPFTRSTKWDVNAKGGPMTLNKYVAHCGIASRRDAADIIKSGKIEVNGQVQTEPGYRVQENDNITYNGKKVIPQRNNVYILLNKPKGFITTTDDEKGRRTVMDLVANAGVDRIYPIGRLDRNTTGVLILTNDGELTQKLSHPSYNCKKIYQVTLNEALTKRDFDKIVAGITLEDGTIAADALAYLEKKNEVGIEIHSGKNRIVRRIFESLGYQVEKLDRVMFAGLTKKNVSRGKWRFLSEKEVILLKHFKG